VPPGDSVKHRLPLVLVYHGADDTASATVTETGLLTVALQRRNMIVAFLQGYQDTWNDDAGNPPAEAANINDVGFTTTALRRIESNWYVDMGRVVATGFSNGAIFAELLGCRSAAYLTAIVPVEGQIATTFSSGCRPQMPISVYEIHATADQSIPYDGGTFQGVGGPVSVMSAPASAALWAKLDKCAARPLRSVSGSSVLSTYQRCSGGVSVTLNSIQGGSHEWPPGFGTTLDGIVSSLGDKRQASKP
jgi:polyhydroxybutyrate depolymerase